MAARYGALQALPEGYRHKDARIDMLDEQDVEKCLLFPTLGDCVEGLMQHDPVIGVQGVPRLQPLARRRLGLLLQGPPRHARAYIPMLDPAARGRGARVPARQGREGDLVATRSGQRPLARRPVVGPVLGPGERVRHPGLLPRIRRQDLLRRCVRPRCGDSRRPTPDTTRSLQGAFGGDRGILETTIALTLGQPLRSLPEREDRQRRDGLRVGAVRAARARPCRRSARAPHPGVRPDGQRPAVGRVQGARLRVAVPGGRRRSGSPR